MRQWYNRTRTVAREPTAIVTALVRVHELTLALTPTVDTPRWLAYREVAKAIADTLTGEVVEMWGEPLRWLTADQQALVVVPCSRRSAVEPCVLDATETLTDTMGFSTVVSDGRTVAVVERWPLPAVRFTAHVAGGPLMSVDFDVSGGRLEDGPLRFGGGLLSRSAKGSGLNVLLTLLESRGRPLGWYRLLLREARGPMACVDGVVRVTGAGWRALARVEPPEDWIVALLREASFSRPALEL